MKTNGMVFAVVVALVFALAASSPMIVAKDAAERESRGGPPVAGEGAKDFRTIYRTAVRSHDLDSLQTKDEPPSPPEFANPGDELTHEWTECSADPQTGCTRYERTDRWQREDAPRKPNGNPNQGEGPYGWYPIKWGSNSCGGAPICLVVPLDPE